MYIIVNIFQSMLVKSFRIYQYGAKTLLTGRSERESKAKITIN